MAARESRQSYPLSLLHALTFVVALCSFAYELVFAELYTVVFGGSVTQYGITIGLFFSSLGLGSFLSGRLEGEAGPNFFRVETYLALVAPLGFLGVIVLGTLRYPAAYAPVVGVVARIPIVAIGFLSGFELPLLTALAEETRTAERDVPTGVLATGLTGVVAATKAACTRVLALGFDVETTNDDDERGRTSAYAAVLGVDYIGGLAGSLVYVFVLYPELGLIASVFVLAFLNGLAALAFTVGTPPLRSGLTRYLPRPVSSTSRALFVVCLLLTATTGGAVASANTVNEEVSEYYFGRDYELDYPEGALDVTVTDTWTTRYQRVTEYTRTWTGTGSNPLFEGTSERCLRLDEAIQLCDSWADSYHHGLVDVPLSLYANGSETNVLLVGGGDWVAMDYLRAHNVTVDHVDIDGEFMQRAKNHSYLAQYHDDAYTYPNKTTHTADAFHYLQQHETRYDLILLDVPGATDDDLLSLYSTEFYTELREHLTERGVVATWTYSRQSYTQHRAAHYNTIAAAGFTRAAPYFAWEDIDADPETERVERFTLLAPGPRPALDPANGSAYVRRYAERYESVSWHDTPTYAGVRTNSIFHPNYDILIE
ncbi:spermidine synthase [Halarchaeum sp. P4]|uniref:spermidine synthase n=1 Tax=Halarchaeum sp. P4 TaxID=3421639 RepID=UPI003EB81C4B